MIKTVCCFNVQKHGDGNVYGWTVPIDMEQIPKDEEIESFIKEVRDKTDEHYVIDCYAIFDENYNPLYKDETFTNEDFAEVFEVSSFYEKRNNND